ncbi:sodium:solute symporter [Roseateles violae]|uniref:Sodium:solute symporter n=1 Tax=Roseateles violae TaxID=3058042 RepID=A0ABT8DXT4_9BURK|nr:sodium:solute symporter [Pelomonas sp. PFR6]MDN3922249.1 sodium:solute symporter [Pelomonas sp. PFR6]
MSPLLLLAFVLAYFVLLLIVAWLSSRGADNESFFIGNKSSHWMLVAFGMIGTSLSGVTFISVPGAVGATAFSYFQIALGQFIGYFVIAYVLLPLYYRLNLSSIYVFLRGRLGPRAYQTGAGFFMVSRTLGATARLYLVVKILQELILERLGLPFWLTALVILLMILAYTFEGGVKTIVWTDTLQTSGMLLGLVICVVYLLRGLDLSLGQSLRELDAAGLSTIFVGDPNSRFFFAKQILAGIFISIAMTGMDQEMMQKNISVRRLADSQKNVITLSLIMLVVVLLFLFLGGLLQLFATQQAMAERGDQLFAAVVLGHLPAWVQLVFVLALISALFPSADGAITALTSSFCIDLLGLQRRQDWSEAKKTAVRRRVHLSFAAVFLLLVLVFRWVDNPSMIGLILKLAGYTYGPLLGLFAFGLLTRRQPRDGWVPLVAIAAPLLCWLIDSRQRALFGAYEIGLELLLLNGALTFAGLWLISSRPQRASLASSSARL